MTAPAQQLPTRVPEVDLSTADLDAILAWTWKTFGDRATFATSLGLEDQVILEAVSRTCPGLPVFVIDTGRLFPEVHDLLEASIKRFGEPIRVFVPEAAEVETLVAEHGTNAFRTSVELRHRCCAVRKVHPLRRALAGKDAWICGLRREQSLSRGEVAPVDWDETNGLVRVNPLHDWTEAQVRQRIVERDLPYNPLHDRGFPSIGCACCTRAIRPGEDPRAGRWWWEEQEKKECGLHGHARASQAGPGSGG